MTIQQVAISEVCDTGSGGTPSRAKQDVYYGGSIPWVKSGELRESVITETEESLTELGLKESAAKLLPRDTLLVALYGATVGRVGILGVEAATNQAVCYLIPDDRRVHRRYLFHTLRSKVPYWLTQRVGGGQPNISQGVIKNTKIPLPPLAEQKRIAEILDREEALRAKRRAALALLDELTQSIFLNMFGDPATNPKGWEQRTLGDALHPERPISYGILKPGDYHSDGVIMLRIQDIRGGSVAVDGHHRVSQALSNQYKRTLLSGGEIVISLVGTIGLCAIIPKSLAGANVHRNLAVVVPREELEPRFLYEYMTLFQFQRLVRETTKGGNQGLLNLGDLKKLPVPIPPLDLQQQFVESIELAKRQESLIRFQLTGLDHLFASLQHRAFQGEL